MTSQNTPSAKNNEAFVVQNWPISIEATRDQLQKAHMRLDRYRAALRLANVEIERRNRSLLALTTFTYQASRTANLTDLLKLALVQALETTGASVGAIVLIDKETRELTLGIHKGLTPDLAKILTGQELRQGAVALMPHLVAGSGALLEYQASTDKMERQLLYASRLTSLVSLPLQLGPRLVGSLLVGLQEQRLFVPAELCFLMALSQELSIALDSVRLREGLWLTAETLMGEEGESIDLADVDETEFNLTISTPFELPTAPPVTSQPDEDDLEHLLAAMMAAEDEVQQQNSDLQTMNTMADMMNRSLNLKEVLQSAVDQTKVTLNTDAVWLYLVEGNLLEMRTHTGLSLDYVRGMQRIKIGRELEGETAAQNKPYFIESMARDYPKHKIWVDKERLHAMAAVPVTRPDIHKADGQNRSHVIGVLAVGKKEVQSYVWNPREVRLLTSISNQLALAINNAQLYAKVQEDEMGLRAGNEVLRTVNDMLLEKNTFLESFIEDDLIPALSVASPVMEHLLAETSNTLTEPQKESLGTLQQVIGRLNNLAKETGQISDALDTAFDEALDEQDKANAYAGSTKPLRLEKKQTGSLNSAETEVLDDTKPLSLKNEPTTEPETAPPKTDGQTGSKPMSFEEAVAAGLVPAHILNRE